MMSRFNPSRSLRGADEPFWIPTGLLQTKMSPNIAWRRRFCVLKQKFTPKAVPEILVRGRVIPSLKPVRSHGVVRFVLELSEGREPAETGFGKAVLARGRQSRREVEPGRYVEEWTERELARYADRVRRFLEFTAAHGILPACAADDAPAFTGSDGDIGVALLEDGVHFFSKGHHRLGCAIALGIARIPVQCHFVAERALPRRSSDWRAEAIARLEELSAP